MYLSLLEYEGIQIRRNEKKFLNDTNADKDGRFCIAFTFLVTKGNEKSVFKPEKKRYFIWLMTAWLVILRFMIYPLPRFHSSIFNTFHHNLDNCGICLYSELKSNWCLCLRIWTPYAQMAVELPGAWKNFFYLPKELQRSLELNAFGKVFVSKTLGWQSILAEIITRDWNGDCKGVFHFFICFGRNMLFSILGSLKYTLCYFFFF